MLARDPGHTAAWYLSGVLAHQLGHHERALECLTRAVELAPREPEYLANLGVAHYALEQWEQAIARWRETIALDAERVDARFHLGLAELARGRSDAAATAFQDVLARWPAHQPARLNLIQLRLNAGRPDAALGLLRDDTELSLHVLVANACLAAGQVEAAARCFERTLELDPRNPDALNGLGNAAIAREQYAAAKAHYLEALEARPGFPEALNNLGNLHALNNDIGEAAAGFTRALESRPDYAEALSNLAIATDLLGDPDSAQTLHCKAIALEPARADWHFNYAVNRLRAEDFTTGWREYEWRLRTSRYRDCGLGIRDRFPAWDGEALNKEQDLLVYYEQGVGDAIFFAGFWNPVVDNPRCFLVHTDRRLVPLFRRAFPGAQVGSAGDEDFDARLATEPARVIQCATGSLPGHAWQHHGGHARADPYLQACPQRRQQWRDRIRALGEFPKVGISWRGGARRADQLRRSLPLDAWRPLLSLPGVTWIDVQYQDCAEERAGAARQHGVAIHRFTEMSPMEDMDDFAALLDALDVLISVDNSTVHLAGALGQRTWVMLPFVADWRWASGRDDARWYSSTKLFRQSSPGRWEDVLRSTAACLSRFIDEGGGRST